MTKGDLMTAEPPAAANPGAMAGYRVRSGLGLGDIGPVYLASAPDGRPAVLTVVRPELAADRAFRERLAEDLGSARTIRSEYVVPLLDADTAGPAPWLATAHVPGPSLRQAVAQYGPMPAATALSLAAGVAQGLADIHAAGLVHRALRASVVLLAPGGPQVTGHGLARALEAATLGGRAVPHGADARYPAPEQITGGEVTAAADVFALGHLVAYAVLGRSPYGPGDQLAVSHRIMQQDPDLAGCPEVVGELIEHCLAKNAEARPAVADIIEYCQTRATPQRALWPAPIPAAALIGKPPGVYGGRRQRRRISRSVAAAGLAGTIVLAATAVGITVLLSKPAAIAAAPSPSAAVSAGPSGGPRAAKPVVPAAPRSPAPAIDPCLVGTWKSASYDVGNITINTFAVIFTADSGPTEVFRADGTLTIDYGKGTTVSAVVGTDHWTETITGNATMHVETSDASMLFSDASGQGSETLSKNGSANNSGGLELETAPTPYSCTGNTLRQYYADGGSIVLTRVGR
jgi:hypothetical protein